MDLDWKKILFSTIISFSLIFVYDFILNSKDGIFAKKCKQKVRINTMKEMLTFLEETGSVISDKQKEYIEYKIREMENKL